jgi:general secretion pathway protein D
MLFKLTLFRCPSVRLWRLLLIPFAVCLILTGSGTGIAAQRGERSSDKVGAKAEESFIKELEFKKTKVQDAVRVISELTGVNIVSTTEAGEKQITFFVRNLSVADIVDSLCRIAGLWYRYNSKTGAFLIMTTEEYQRDIVVFRNEPIRAFKLKYLNVGTAARTISDLFGDRVQLEGKANRHLGDDYKVGKASSAFSDDFDEGTMDDEDDDDSSSSSSSSSSSKNKKDRDRERNSKKKGSEDLTAAKLALLDELQTQKRQNQMISEATMGQVSQQQTEAAIYVTVNRMHNMLFVRTSDDKAMEEIARIIHESDLQVPEVLLEMKVLEVQLTDEYKSAFDISSISGSQKTGPDDGQAINPLNTSAASVGSTTVGSGNYGVMENSTMVFQVLSGNLRVRLQLLEEEGNISSIATPMLLAANNHPAKLFIGEETILTTGFTAESVSVTSSSSDDVTVNTVPVPETEKRSIGNTLSILPSINADRSVVMRIVHENSSVETDGGKIPVLVGSSVQYVNIDTVNSSTLEGTVLAQDGMTVAVGGMMRTSKSDSASKVPVLGDIPLLGFFFREDGKSTVKTELVLLITPHVLSAPSQGEDVSRRRLNALTSHPNQVDMYFDELDRSREDSARANLERLDGDGRQPSGAAAERDAGGLEKSFIELTRVAAKQVRMPLLLRKPDGSVKSAPLPALGEVRLFAYKGVSAVPAAAWTNGYHYITAIKVVNHGKREQALDVAQMKGSWRAATLEQQVLAPTGKEGDVTYLYLISDQPFEKTMGSWGK